LGIDYLDLYLIHWPDRSKPLALILEAMERVRRKGLVLQIGVSNFTVHHLQDVLASGAPIAANQVEFHPYLYQKELLDFCQKRQIRLVSYRPFGKGSLLQEPVFAEVGQKYGKNSAQVILRWLTQKNIPVIPKASSELHLKENISIFDFSLSEEDLLLLDQLPHFQRFCGAGDPEFDY
jgi:diketogulonate reductase-like aldo/keto reductase